MYVAEKVYYDALFGIWVDVCNGLLPMIRKSESTMLAVCETDVPKKCFLRAYLLQPRIETLQEKEKIELWGYVKEKFPGRSRTELIDRAKIIYTIGRML